MDSIKIVDKLTLRQEALRMAIKIHEDVLKGSADIYGTANKCADYIRMNADLPEYVDPNADKQQWVDMLNKMREEMKPNPWISADSEMKPAKDMPIVTKVSDSDNYFIGKYNETGWIIPNAPNGSSVVAWMPIPPFVEPLKL